MNMIQPKILATLAAGFFLVGAAQADTTNTFTSVGSLIPDNDPNGIASSTNLAGISGTVGSVVVSLDVTGGFNGDLYAYLAGPGGFVVLLNRSGVTAGNSVGYGDSGYDVTFSDSAAYNIHGYQADSPTITGGVLGGAWQPDGRNIDPASSGSTFDSTSPSTPLSLLNGSTADGTWTLFIADMSPGGQATLVSWGLSVVTVPEPQTWVLVAGGVVTLLALNRRRKL